MSKVTYYWDEVTDNVSCEEDENGHFVASYQHQPGLYGELVSQERDGDVSYYHYDGQGNTLALADQDGAVTDTAAYTAYGETVEQTGSTVNPFGYGGAIGYYTNTDTADIYIRARTYAPSLGRWSSRDPIGYQGGASQYNYVSGRPVSWVDPSGLVKIYNVDDSPKCVTGSPSYESGHVDPDSGDYVPEIYPAEPAGRYWGIMVELSPSEKRSILRDGGGFLVFTIRNRSWSWDCQGTQTAFSDETSWMATAVIVLNGEVKMHHTNDRSLELQYLQVSNSTTAFEACGGKSRDYHKVTVEVLTKSQARRLIHIDRFPNVPHVPSPRGPGPIDDEVGVDATDRPWQAGGDRSGIPRATATSDIEFDYCGDPATCSATSSGTSGSRSRSGSGYSPRGFPDPWPF